MQLRRKKKFGQYRREFFKLLLTKCQTSECFKMARVTPIPKKGDITLMNNLRPISNTPLPSKLLEKYVNNIIYKHIESNNLFFKNQNGFRKGRSTIQAVNEVVNRLYNYRIKGELSTFADDTAIIAHGVSLTDLVSQITDDIGKLKEWFYYNKLTFNSDKE